MSKKLRIINNGRYLILVDKNGDPYPKNQRSLEIISDIEYATTRIKVIFSVIPGEIETDTVEFEIKPEDG